MDVLYLRTLLERLGGSPPSESLEEVFEDNTACIEWGNNVIGGRERAKHIDIRKHLAHEVIQNGKMPTAFQLAGIFTKSMRGGHPRQRTVALTSYPDLGPQEGEDSQGSQVESRRPLGGVCQHD